ncbi:TKL protein kinase [Phytophthora palmivora]|uniref:TKL protein kinase n=1 Tax=Phytophthora palmivora TaxID=4796 RepID=A0A2P4YKA0_9STRA|nr:TKL protein kinase [Phytophthora palmivora]
MAPEVMLGEKYDEKADIFSFGVVLSEIDVHTLPYSHTKSCDLSSACDPMADAALLQRITIGAERVEFSTRTPQSIVELGQACTSLNPGDRPSAAEALYKLHAFVMQNLKTK